MSFLSKVKQAKEILAATPKPASSFDLKYGKAKEAKTAWRLYFKYLLISLKTLAAGNKGQIHADVIPLPLNKKQKLFLDELLNFLHQAVSEMATATLEFTQIMNKYKDNETFDLILTEFYADFAYQLTKLRQKVQGYKNQAESLSLAHSAEYKKYIKYLDELSKLTAEIFIHDYLFKNKIPLEDFDDEFLD